MCKPAPPALHKSSAALSAGGIAGIADGTGHFVFKQCGSNPSDFHNNSQCSNVEFTSKSWPLLIFDWEI